MDDSRDAVGTERTIAVTRDGADSQLTGVSKGAGPDLRLGTLVDSRYRILRKLGDGGMGTVYEAEHVALGQRVAVKFLHAQFVTDADVVRRFLQEARAAASIGHPGIIKALDVGRTAEGAPFLALELLDGHDLSLELASVGSLSIGRAVGIAREVAAALGAAHAKDIVHRDLKPENIFLASEQGIVRAKVLDFGISKIRGAIGTGSQTQEGTILGTPTYMAPEQLANASDVDARADVYALGGVLYTMLTGKRPFEAPTFPRLVMMVVSERPESIATLRSDVPPGLIEVIEHAMAKDPTDRYSDMAALDAALAAFDSRVETPIPEGDLPRALAVPTVPGRRRSRSWPTVALVLGGALALTAWLIAQRHPAHEATTVSVEPVARTAAPQLQLAPAIEPRRPEPLTPVVPAPPTRVPVGAPPNLGPSRPRVHPGGQRILAPTTPVAPITPTAPSGSSDPRLVSASSAAARALFGHVAFCWRDAREAHQLPTSRATVSLAAGSSAARIVGVTDTAFLRCTVTRISERVSVPDEDLSISVELPGVAP